MKAAADSGLSTRAFAVFWTLKDDAALESGGHLRRSTSPRKPRRSVRAFPNAAVNPDEQRRLRASLYRPLLALGERDRAQVGRSHHRHAVRLTGVGRAEPVVSSRCAEAARALSGRSICASTLASSAFSAMRAQMGFVLVERHCHSRCRSSRRAIAFQDFVIVHELLHFRVPNHGRLFKALMTAHVPGWRQWASEARSGRDPRNRLPGSHAPERSTV